MQGSSVAHPKQKEHRRVARGEEEAAPAPAVATPPRPPSTPRPLPLLFFLLSLLAASSGAAAATTEVEFSEARVIASDLDEPFAVSAADINGDGNIDVLVAARLGPTIAWHENQNEDGGVEAEELFLGSEEGIEVSRPSSGRDGPRSISVGDIDGDGIPDVVAAFEFTDTVTWYRNADGTGGFSSGVDIATDTPGATWVTLADIDGDGDLDVLSASLGDDRVVYFENTDGQGTFSTGVNISTTAVGANMVIAADLDNDGDLDVVSVSYDDNRVTWYENVDGEGTFSEGIDVATDLTNPTYVVAADLDGDGDIDLAVASFSDGRFVWYRNTDGAGSFASEGIDIDTMDSAQSIVAADVDLDGDLDLVTSDYEGSRIVWFENLDGEGTFSAAIEIAVEAGVWEVITVDFDGDGDVDLLAASRDSGRLLWYENLLPAATPSPIDDSATSLVDETTNSADASGITPANDSDTTSSAADSTDDDGTASTAVAAACIAGLVVLAALLCWLKRAREKRTRDSRTSILQDFALLDERGQLWGVLGGVGGTFLAAMIAIAELIPGEENLPWLVLTSWIWFASSLAVLAWHLANRVRDDPNANNIDDNNNNNNDNRGVINNGNGNRSAILGFAFGHSRDSANANATPPPATNVDAGNNTRGNNNGNHGVINNGHDNFSVIDRGGRTNSFTITHANIVV